MNNTMVLGVFLGLMCFVEVNGRPAIAWNFTAETVAIMAVEVIVFCFAVRRFSPLWHCIVIASLLPASLFLVLALHQAGLH